MKKRSRATLTIIALCAVFFPAQAFAQNYPLTGTTSLSPGQTVIPGLAPAGSPLGTAVPPTTIASPQGVSFRTGMVRQASGTLDFYFQLTNNLSAGSVFTRLSTGAGFAPYATSVGFLLDGSSVPFIAIPFLNGTVPPVTADRDTDGIIGFNFGAGFLPGLSSHVFVISTNATNFTSATSTLEGRSGTNTILFPNLTSLVPSGPAVPVTTVPEHGGSVLLFALSFAGLWMTRRIAARANNSPADVTTLT